MFIIESDLYNFAHDHTITENADIIETLIKLLETMSSVAVDWFKINEVIVNPDKFQSIIINRCGRYGKANTFQFGQEEIRTSKSVDLLGIEIVKN